MEENKKLREVCNIDLRYVDDCGVDKIKHIEINFISQKIMREYYKYLDKITKFKEIYERFNKVTSDIGQAALGTLTDSVLKNGTPKNKGVLFNEKVELTKNLILEKEELECEIRSYSESDFFVERFTLITMILRKNGITDKDLLSFDWWDDCVDSGELADFITMACEKDRVLVEHKKKVRQELKNSERTDYSQH